MAGNLPKVVVVGFNKCATRSLALLFSRAGYPAIHHKLRRPFRRSRNAARIMQENIRLGRPVFTGIEGYTLYSDLVHITGSEVFEGNSVFDRIVEDYPGTILILNVRDRGRWIQSRLRHGHGEFALRYMKAAGCRTREELEALWARGWDEHLARVRSYAAAHDVRLIEYNVESDPPERLIAALPEFGLRVEHWGDTGRSRGRDETSLITRLRRAWAHVRPRSFR